MPVVVALTVLGAALRLAYASQSLAADELSTRFVIAGHSLGDVLSIVHTDAEITPPLSFVASWLTTRVDLTPELLRAPAVVAGTLTIPLVYAVGVRTVGPRAALVATALTTLSPFMVFYGAEARGYGLMIALVLGSTLALLRAVDAPGRRRWWVLYAICACAAVYTHYTSVFALAGQALWALWAHPAARRPLLVASAAAAVAFLPWLGGLRGDFASPTTDILSALQPFDVAHVRTSLAHWAIGYAYALPGTGVGDLPGTPALVAFAAAVAIGLGALVVRVARGRVRIGRGLALALVLAASVPVGEAVVSAVGSNLLSTRNLAASWPGFALCLAALVAGAGRRAGILASILAVGAFAIAAVKLLGPDFRRPDYEAVAAYIEREAEPGDVVVDGAIVSPVGVPTALDVTLRGNRRVFQLGQSEVRYDPFRLVALPPPVDQVVGRAVAAAGRHRVLLILPPRSPAFQPPLDALPPGARRVASARFPGSVPLTVLTYQTASGA